MRDHDRRQDRRHRARNTAGAVLCALLFTTVLTLNACSGDESARRGGLSTLVR